MKMDKNTDKGQKQMQVIKNVKCSFSECHSRCKRNRKKKGNSSDLPSSSKCLEVKEKIFLKFYIYPNKKKRRETLNESPTLFTSEKQNAYRKKPEYKLIC